MRILGAVLHQRRTGMEKPFIVAEIAQGYEGSEKLVELYVKAASLRMRMQLNSRYFSLTN